MSELRECPFCGEPCADLDSETQPNGVVSFHFAYCFACSAHGPTAFNPAAAASAWNSRTIEGRAMLKGSE